jgi:PIN domain nuclease of toxin-antitoxin system
VGDRLSTWLADVSTLIGFCTVDLALPVGLRKLLESGTADMAVAATTIWEIAIKTARRRLAEIRSDGHATLCAMLRAHGFTLLPLDAATAQRAARLPPLHADPFDRALVALTQRSGRTVLTSDAMTGR